MALLDNHSVSSFHVSCATKAANLGFAVRSSSACCWLLEVSNTSAPTARIEVNAPATKAYPRNRKIGAQLIRNPQATKATNDAMKTSRPLRAIILDGSLIFVVAA